MNLRRKRHTNGPTMHDPARKRAFGLKPTDKWPDQGLAARTLQTPFGPILHEVMPKNSPLHKRRALALCPQCQKWVCAGHLGQHFASHLTGVFK